MVEAGPDTGGEGVTETPPEPEVVEKYKTIYVEEGPQEERHVIYKSMLTKARLISKSYRVVGLCGIPFEVEVEGVDTVGIPECLSCRERQEWLNEDNFTVEEIRFLNEHGDRFSKR